MSPEANRTCAPYHDDLQSPWHADRRVGSASPTSAADDDPLARRVGAEKVLLQWHVVLQDRPTIVSSGRSSHSPSRPSPDLVASPLVAASSCRPVTHN